MKKICGFFAFLCVAVSVFVYAVEVKDGYLYGDLSIAYNNELPSGLFAKSRNYLPGDTLHISNPFTGEEINVLNLSSLDEDSGCALMLTTEAANRLGIDFKEPLYVRVSPRTNDFDEIASGSVILTRNKDAVLVEAPVAQNPEDADEGQKAPPAQEPVKVAEVALDPEPEKKDDAADDSGPAVAQEDASASPEPPVASAVLPKVEPVADLSTLAEPMPIATDEPPVAVKQQAKKEEPAAEKPVGEAKPEKKDRIEEFAEETAVFANEGKKSFTTVTTVTETRSDQLPEAPQKAIEEVAVKKDVGKQTKKKSAAKPQAVYEQPVSPLPVPDGFRDAAAEEAYEELVVLARNDGPDAEEETGSLVEESVVDLIGAGAVADLPDETGLKDDSSDGADVFPPVADDAAEMLVLAEEGVELPAVLGAANDMIPVITEESVKLASNGFTEVPSANLAVLELPAGRAISMPSPDDAVFEYPQTLSSGGTPDLIEEKDAAVEVPVSFVVPSPAVEDEAFVSEEPVSGASGSPVLPEAQANEAPVLASFVPPAGSDSGATVPESAEPAGVIPSPVAELTESLSDVSQAEPETVLPEPPVPPLAQRTSLSKAEPQKLAPEPVHVEPAPVETAARQEAEEKTAVPAVRNEDPVVAGPVKPAGTPKKESSKPAVVETEVKPVQKKPAAKVTKPAKPAKTEEKAPSKREVQLAARKESKPVAKKEAKPPVREDPASEEEELVYTQTEELMLIPGGAGEQKAYSGESTAAPASAAKDSPQRQPVKSADAGAEADDSENIIVNKQDVFTLSPADSIGPDGKQGDGQKVYTPQKPEVKSPGGSGAKGGTAGPAGKGNGTGNAAAPSRTVEAVREKDLKAGNYVQFATCTTDAEAEKIAERYKKYPVIKVAFEGREGYKLLVGPLGEDEKGAVLVRFKAFGFTDAYLRKVK